MESQDHLPSFQGRPLRLLLHICLFLIVAGFIVTLGLMGENWKYPFSASLIVTMPAVFLYVLIVSRGDRFSFDDAAGVIVKPFGRNIPYQSVQAVQVKTSMGLMQVGVKQGRLGQTTLALALDAQDKDRLLAELGRRFSQETIRERRLREWTILFALLAVITAALTFYHWHLRRACPQLSVMPQQAAWTGAEQLPRRAPRYPFNTFVFSLPLNFDLTLDKDNELVFTDRGKRTRLSAVYGLHTVKSSGFEFLLQRGTGLRGYYDILKLSYEARVGIVPLVLKRTLFEGMSDVTITRVERGALRGFVLRGRRGKEAAAHILIEDKDSGEEVEFFISGAAEIPERTLRKIVGSVQTLKGELHAR